MPPKYPHINVALVGEDGNAFAIIGRCRRLARQAGLPQTEIDAFTHECETSGNYYAMLGVVMSWFDCD